MPTSKGDVHLIVVMGVSGSGKTTVARGIADAKGWIFGEGDKFHPPENVAKMAAGTPLTDEDRGPWLAAIGRWLDERCNRGESAVLTCSALRRSYRDALSKGRPAVRFCELRVPPEVLGRRLQSRAGHYMPASLLPSQLATLESLQPDEPGTVVVAHGDPSDVVAEALTALGLT